MDTHGEAIVKIREEGGDSALRLVGDLMERNARDAAWLADQVLAAETARADRAEAKCERLEERLATMHARFMWLMGADLTDDERERM